MIHLDVKKVGRIPPGGGGGLMGAVPPRRRPPSGARAPGLATPTCTPPSTASRVWPTPRPWTVEKVSTTIGFFCRARAFFAAHGVTRLVRVVTDNGANYRARTFTAIITSLASRHQRNRPYTPITARSSATTASWPRSASTRVPTPHSSSAVTPSRCGTTTTTTIDPTPPAATSLPPPASQHTSPTS